MRKLVGLLLALCAIFPASIASAENFYPPRIQPAGGYQIQRPLYSYPSATRVAVNTGNTGSAYNQPTATPAMQLSAEEMKLYNMINEYRLQKGLKAIPLSKSLTAVAQSHVRDLAINHPNDGRVCNLHSWSAKGPWSPVCYTDDHKNAQGMWSKPREITGYRGQGYEIAMGGWSDAPGGYRANATEALRGWQRSPGHNQIIVNQSIWTTSDWKALGVGIYQGYAVAWFGETPDTVPANVAIK